MQCVLCHMLCTKRGFAAAEGDNAQICRTRLSDDETQRNTNECERLVIADRRSAIWGGADFAPNEQP